MDQGEQGGMPSTYFLGGGCFGVPHLRGRGVRGQKGRGPWTHRSYVDGRPWPGKGEGTHGPVTGWTQVRDARARSL